MAEKSQADWTTAQATVIVRRVRRAAETVRRPEVSKPSGYDPRFLRDVYLPMPGGPGLAPSALHYPHFSIVLNPQRRLAAVAAVNVDIHARKEVPRGNRDLWWYDPQAPREWMVDESLYPDGPYDRSRLVKRLQPAWGSSAVAREGMMATGSMANVVPLIAEANRDRVWSGLPDYMASRMADDGRLVMFAGPVLDKVDEPFRGVPIPQAYWRVFVLRRKGQVAAFAFLLEQRPFRRTFRFWLVPISELARRTGLDFGVVADLDGRRDADWVEMNRLDVLESVEELEAGAKPPASQGTDHGFEYDAYFSYDRADNEKGWVSRLRDSLGETLEKALGRHVDLFFNTSEIPRATSWTKTNNTIRRSAVFVPILSPAYVNSRLCMEELATFLDTPAAETRIVPVVKFAVAPNTLPPQMRQIQQIPFFHISLETHTPRELEPSDVEFGSRIAGITQIVTGRIKSALEPASE